VRRLSTSKRVGSLFRCTEDIAVGVAAVEDGYIKSVGLNLPLD